VLLIATPLSIKKKHKLLLLLLLPLLLLQLKFDLQQRQHDDSGIRFHKRQQQKQGYRLMVRAIGGQLN
jgi:hypothetical protein